MPVEGMVSGEGRLCEWPIANVVATARREAAQTEREKRTTTVGQLPRPPDTDPAPVSTEG